MNNSEDPADMAITRTFRKIATVFLGAAMLGTAMLSGPAASAAPHPDDEFKAFDMWFDVGNLSNTNSCIPAWVTARYRDPSGSDTWTRLVRTNASGCDSDQEHLQNWGDFQSTHSRVNLLGGPKPANHLIWKNLTSMTLTVTTPNTPPGRQKNVRVTKWFIRGLTTNNEWKVLVDDTFDFVFADGHNDKELFVRPPS